MISFETLFSAGGAGFLVLGLGALAALVGLVAGALTVFGWRVPPPITVLFASMPLFAAIGHGVLNADLSGAVAKADPARRAMIAASQVSATINVRIVAGSATLFLLFVLGMFALAGVVRGPRSLASPALALGAVALQAVLGTALLAGGDAAATLATVIVLVVTGLPVVLAAVAGDPEKGGPEAAITAAFCWMLAVTAWWGAVHARQEAVIFGAIAAVDPEQKGRLLAMAMSEIWLDRPLGVLSALVAATPALGGMFAARSDPGRRVAWMVLCAPALLIPVIYLGYDPVAWQIYQLMAELYRPS